MPLCAQPCTRWQRRYAGYGAASVRKLSMSTMYKYDAIVIGAGPNGLAAAITIARTGRSVIVFEAKETIGGGSRSMELTLPGFVHDVCSAIHPLGLGSIFFRKLPLEQYGLEWIHPSA